MRLKIQARIRQRPATGTPRQSRLARASLHLFAAQRSRRPERILPQKPGERPRPPPPPNATEKASSARDPGRPRYRETAGLERQNEASKGDQDEQPGAQKRKKGPKALFSSTQAETWIMLGAGNETCTRRVSRCFPNSFFAEVLSEDLNCSLVFGPRQQVRPKKSIDVQRRTLRAPDPHPAHRHPRGLELAIHIPFSASASSPRCRLGSRLPMSGSSDATVERRAPSIVALISASHAEERTP